MIALAIFLGGGLGSLLRYITGISANHFFKTDFPLGTLLSNILACIILGLVVFQFKDQIKSDGFLFYFLVVGICGGFSTFSTFSMESVQLAQAGAWTWVGLNIVVSLITCFSLIWILARQG